MITTTSPVRIVLPGDVDDVTVPSGGNVYDRRLCEGLASAGRPMNEIVIPGGWPNPDTNARAALARSLAAAPDGSVVLLDGLVACGVPEVIVPESRRLRLAVLLHLPLARETGLAPEEAARLDARERETLHAAHAVVATSPAAGRQLIEHHGLPTSRVHVVPPGTEPAPLARGTDGVSRLLCVASVTRRKGQDLLVRALASVADLPWTCVCAGPLGRDSAYVAELRQLIAELELTDRVRLAGPLTGEPLAASYDAADLAVLVSHAETYGMVVTEALARGIPVLATAVDGVPETLGQTPGGDIPGLLVPPADPPALAAALRRWFEEPELRRHLREAARVRRSALQSWEETSRRMAGVFEQLAGARGGESG